MWRVNRPPGRECEMVDFLIGMGLGLAVGAVVGWVLGVEFGGTRVAYMPPDGGGTARRPFPTRGNGGGRLGNAQGISGEELEKAIRERVEELEREGA